MYRLMGSVGSWWRRITPAAAIPAALLLGPVLWTGCESGRLGPGDKAYDCPFLADSTDFGELLVGETKLREIVLTNVGPWELDLVATLDDPDFHLHPRDSLEIHLGIDGKAYLPVTFSPASVGPKSARIRLVGATCPGIVVTGGTPAAIPGYVTEFPLGNLRPDPLSAVAVAVDSQGRILVDFYDRYYLRGRYPGWQRTVVVWAPDGSVLGLWGPIAENPDGLAAAPDGTVYMVDAYEDLILHCSVTGGVLGLLGSSRVTPGKFESPTDVTVDEQGMIYVADGPAGRVQRFSRDGEYDASWWQYFPRRVQSDRAGRVFVCGRDRYDSRVPIAPALWIYTTEGGLLARFQNPLLTYEAVAGDPGGYFYVAITPYLDPDWKGIARYTAERERIAYWDLDRRFSDVTTDRAGFLYAVTADSLFKFTVDGALISIWPFGGVAVTHREGEGLFVLDADHVTRLTTDGAFLGRWGGRGSGTGEFRDAEGIAGTPEGTILVADTGNRRIQELGRDGEFLREFGNRLVEEGWPRNPSSIVVDERGNIYVASLGDDTIQKFAPDGSFLTMWGGTGEAVGRFDGPRGLAVGGSGQVYVWDTGNRRVQVFDTDGGFLRSWEPVYRLGAAEPWPPRWEWQAAMAGMAAGADDVVYLADYAHHTVVVFDDKGGSLGYWGGFGSEAGRFNRPRGLAVGPEGRIYVVDTENYRVQVFERYHPGSGRERK